MSQTSRPYPLKWRTFLSFDPDARAQADAGIFGLDCTAALSQVVLIPVPFDATASYGRRAALGPRSILAASHQVDLLDRECGRPYLAGIHMQEEPDDVGRWNDEARALCDAARDLDSGDSRNTLVAQVNALCEKVNDWVYGQARELLAQGKIVGVVGGDHSVPLGSIRAHLERYPRAGILHIDAHADLRHAYEGFTSSHASIMHNVVHRTSVSRLVQVGIRDFGEGELAVIEASAGRITTFFDSDMAIELLQGGTFSHFAERVVACLPQEIYVSFDIDGLDPTLCPNTGTPVPGGLSFHQATYLLAEIGRSGRRLVGFDLNEVAPGVGGSEWDGNVGARLLYKLIGHSLASGTSQ